MSRSSKENSHRSWMNQSGPMPLNAITKYFAMAGIPSNTPSLAATTVLKYPTIQWNTNKPIVAGTRSLRVRALNHVFPSYFSKA